MRPSNNVMRKLSIAAALAALAGCSEYVDRRDSIALSAGDAVASDKVTHMVDPWPRESANRNIAFDGNKMESAFERYRTNKVIPPRATGTSTIYQQDPGAAAAQNNTAPVGPTVTQSSAQVK